MNVWDWNSSSSIQMPASCSCVDHRTLYLLFNSCVCCNLSADMLDKMRFRLEPTGDAKRSRAIATKDILAGNVILSTRPLSTVLVPFQKGRRCDYCLRRLLSTL